MNQRGALSPAGWFLIIIGGIVLIALIAPFFSTERFSDLFESTKDDVKFGDAINLPALNFISYIAGGIPQFLIEFTNPISASIIIFGLFIVLTLIFSDILSLFGSFSSPAIAWAAGIVLAIIAANLKIVMWIVVVGFAITSGLGAFAAILGIATPFITFLVIHFLFLGNLKEWALGRKNAQQFKAGVRDMTEGVEGAKEFGKAVRGK